MFYCFQDTAAQGKALYCSQEHDARGRLLNKRILLVGIALLYMIQLYRGSSYAVFESMLLGGGVLL